MRSTASEETLLELGRGDIKGHIQALEAEVPFRPGQAAIKLSAMYQGVAVHTTPEYNKAVKSGDMEAADSFFWEMLKKAFLEGEATAKRRVKQLCRATAARPNDHAINLNLQKTPSCSFSAKLAAITSSGGRKKVKDTEGSPDKKEQDTEREIEPPKFVLSIRKKEEKEIVAPLDTDE
ncbi:hypothetical protein D6D10_03293 [Aureobasidium pullulans]|uniref:Uncharacterized protein n=1 Tax=Aureobasidium pullulans TaxID=5580 RepID=A0A4V4J8P3_AURPU|nr:hypothetical protein D6D10_03293 [Aureobasidium pullulans]